VASLLRATHHAALSSPTVEIRTIQNVVLDGAEGVNRPIAPLVPQTNAPAPVQVQIQPN
jgi:hypothetical protein